MQNGGVTRARVTGSPTNERASQLRAHTAKEVTNPVVRRDYSSNGVDGRVVCVSRSFESKLTLLETVRYSTSLSLSLLFLPLAFFLQINLFHGNTGKRIIRGIRSSVEGNQFRKWNSWWKLHRLLRSNSTRKLNGVL